MLTNFTWWQFLGTFLLFSAIYYPLILSLYFRKEVASYWKKFVAPAGDVSAGYELGADEQNNKTNIKEQASVTFQEDTASIFTALKEDIHNGVKAAADSGVAKDQLLALIKNILAKYPQLKTTGHQVQINEFIIQECARSNYAIYMAQVYALWANATDTNE